MSLEPPAPVGPSSNIRPLFPKNRQSHVPPTVRPNVIEPVSSELTNKYLYLERELIFRTTKTWEALQEIEARVVALETNQRQILEVLKMLSERTQGV